MAEQQLLSTYLYVLTIPGIDTIGYFSSVTGIEIRCEVHEYREGGNNEVVHRLPGRLTYPNLMLERGLTDEVKLLEWFMSTQTQAERKAITITMQGCEPPRRFTFADAFPVGWTGPQAVADESGIGTETLEIAHGGLRPA